MNLPRPRRPYAPPPSVTFFSHKLCPTQPLYHYTTIEYCIIRIVCQLPFYTIQYHPTTPPECLPRKLPALPLPPKKVLLPPMAILHIEVSFLAIPDRGRDLTTVLESRTNADHFDTDMIIDAIVNVSESALRQTTSLSPKSNPVHRFNVFGHASFVLSHVLLASISC